MVKKKEKSKKDPEDYPLFNMRLSKEDKEKYKKFAKGYNLTLAKLVREGLKVIENNPAFLNPMEDPYLAKIKKLEKPSEEYLESVEREIFLLKEEVQEMKNTLYLIAAKQEIQINGKDDDSSKAVFEK